MGTSWCRTSPHECRGNQQEWQAKNAGKFGPRICRLSGVREYAPLIISAGLCAVSP